MLSLAGKVALVTGCGSFGEGWGNGKAIATLFARQGATVVGIDIDGDAAAVTQKIVESEGNSMRVCHGNVTVAADCQRLVETTLAEHGQIDILVNNVGRSEPGNGATMSEQVWREQLDTNLTSAFLMAQAVLPAMMSRSSGTVLGIASVAGVRWVGKDQVAYAAAKAAMIQYSRVSAVAFAKHGIRFNCVVPGLMDTPLVQRLADRYHGGDYAGMVEGRNAQVPMGRMGTAWDVAHAALFLASDEARYITGVDLMVDGGLVASTGGH